MLNRVTSLDMPSVINGALNSNGHVHLVNPSGIMVGATGVINTNAFVASTFDIANSDFLKGGALTFSDSGSNAAIVNNGTINTGAGGAHLIANDIANNGSITSVGGNITMSGGGSVTLSNGVNYVQPTLETLASGISPTAGLINNTGTIRATGAATSGGEVYLVNPNGKILHNGTIAANVGQASSLSGSGDRLEAYPTTGGHVQLEADDITLAKGSSIDASGTHGGGEVLVGGDWQGSGEMSQATSVTMESGAKIDASATVSGNGGKIVLWSDITNADSITKAFGTLIARAGELLGDGGQIETSGATVETDGISVNAGATNGLGGLWLIDPYDYTIDATAATNIVNTLNTGTSVTVTTTSNNASYGSSGTNTDLGDIVVNSNIVTGAMSGDATLTLQAHRHINVDANIDATQNGNIGKLNVTLLADSDHSGDGISIMTSDSIKTNGGNLTFGDGSTATIGGSSVQVGGDVYINGTAAQSLETGGGTITVNGETILANTNGVTFDSGNGNIVFGGVLNSGNQYTAVTSTQTWLGAVAHAKSGNGDQLGDTYLATITSRLENAIAGIAVDYGQSWLGGRRVTGIGTDSAWRWVTGPEGLQDSGKGLIFATGSNGATPVDGAFTNWNTGEPNNSGNNETVVQFVGAAGQWNDLPHNSSTLTQYVRETNLAPTGVTINGGTGSVTINGGVGGGKALASLDITSSATTVAGDSLITTGAQNYSSTLDVTSTIGLDVDGTTLTTVGALDFAATGDIDISASMVVPGAISIVGNVVVISGNLTSSATGDIYLQSNAQATTALSVSGSINKTGGDRSTLRLRSDGRLDVGAITASGAAMDVVLWSDFQNANAGGIGIAGTVNTNGGHFWAGGSSTVQGSETWNGLTVGDGGSAGNVNANWNAFDMHGDINTGGGDVLLWAAQPHSSGIDGIALNANHTISAGSGDITLIADDVSGAVLTIDTTGHFTYQPDGNAWSGVGSQFDFNGSITSDTFTGTGDALWLKINNYRTLGGLTLGKDGNTSHIYAYNP
ncbi:MAG: filamentous hemagglutinin N-terminal domain-containing protein, partial [Rubripirellula sp.]